MDGTTIIPRLSDRPVQASARSFDCATMAAAAAVADVVSYRSPVEVFKKTPCAAGLSRAGRDVAQHMPEVDDTPCLTMRLIDRNGRQSGSPAARSAIAESSNNVMWMPCQDVLRSADNPVTSMGDGVGPGGTPVAGIAGAGVISMLSHKELARRPSKSTVRATNPAWSVWTNARPPASCADGAVAVARQGLREAM
jgi:hypothetical protein